jgi:hypothetical protein
LGDAPCADARDATKVVDTKSPRIRLEREGEDRRPWCSSTRSRSRHARRAPTVERARVDEQNGDAMEGAVHRILVSEIRCVTDQVFTLIIRGRVITVNSNVHAKHQYSIKLVITVVILAL